MTQDLTELLEQTANAVPVSQPPTDLLLRAARDRRRRRSWSFAVLGGVAAAATVVAVVVMAQNPARPGPDPIRTPISTSLLLAHARLVGVGHLSIAVPKTWGTNQTRCGTAVKNTVIFTGGAVPLCAVVPAHVPSSVRLSLGADPQLLAGGSQTTIDGVQVTATDVTCVDRQPAFTGLLCTAGVFVPGDRVLVELESAHRGVIEALLATIQISPDQVAVPNYEGADAAAQEHAQQHYVALLQLLGLKAEVRKSQSTVWPPGFVLSVSPAVGQVLQPGDTVTVTVAG